MKTVMTFKLRKQAEDAADFLISHGVPANIRGFDLMPGKLAKFRKDEVELTVQDINYTKAQELLQMRESGGLHLPSMDFKFKLPWSRKSE